MKTCTIVPVALCLLAGCSVVKMHRVRPDYADTDRQKTKRLVLVVQPLPNGDEKVGELWSLVARRYVDQKRNFILKRDLVQAAGFQPQAVCGEGVEGALWLEPDVKPAGEGYEVGVKGRLLRCADGQEVWAAEAGGSFPSHDERLVEVGNHYASEVGDKVKPHVAPASSLRVPRMSE